jgi:flagellar FliL protein
MLFALIGVLVGLGGGGGAYWVYASRMAPPAAAKPAPPPTTGIVPMEPFVVNLADEGGSRFLRVTLSLVVEGEEHAKEIEESDVIRARLRSAILERLTLQKADHLVTPDGKTELKKAIAEQAAHAAHDLKVTDVLFSEFVVQF